MSIFWNLVGTRLFNHHTIEIRQHNYEAKNTGQEAQLVTTAPLKDPIRSITYGSVLLLAFLGISYAIRAQLWHGVEGSYTHE